MYLEPFIEFSYDENGYMSERYKPHKDEKYQLKTTHGFSKKDQQITPQGRLQLAPKLYYTHAGMAK